VLLVAFVSSVASAQANFDSFVTFGDSLTHNDVLGTVYGTPQALYGADPMEAVFLKAAFPGDDLYRFAVAGSLSDDVSGQIDLYEFLVAIGFQERATLISLEAGSNDVLDHFALLAASAPGQNPTADAVIDGIIANLRADFLRLRRSHPGVLFLVWTLPDVTLAPRYFGLLTPTEEQNVRAHLFRVNRLIRKGNNKPRFVVLDAETALGEIIATPPILRGQPLVPPPAHGEFGDIFADEVHPTSVTNALAANETVLGINDKWGNAIPLYTEDELADLAQFP
jgi:lysophospholipase L1-like esterase